MSVSWISARSLLAGAALAALLTNPVRALAAESASDDDAEARTIIVVGDATGYVAQESVTATKTDTPLIDVPQSISVVTRELLDDHAHHSIADVLRYVPGATVGQGEGNRDQITLRGQNSTADFFLDGVRDDVQYFRSLYNIDRVEILKGPYAMIFGRGGGGGIVNRVQKTPQAETFFLGASASANSFGAWDLSADVNVPLGSMAAVRLNAFHESLDSHRDFAGGDRFGFNPYVAVDLGSGWRLGLSYEYVDDDRVNDRGVPSVACVGARCIREPLKRHRDTFFGVPGINRAELEAHIAKLRLDGELADNLSWSTTALYGDYDKYYANVFANSAVRLADNTIELDGYRDDTDRKNVIVQSNLVWDVEFGAIGNKILLGVEYGDQKTGNSRFVSPARPRIDVDNFTFPAFIQPFPNASRATHSDVEFFSFYIQDQISIGEHVDIVGGIRYDHIAIKGANLINNTPFARTDEKWSPRIGVIVKPRPEMSIYASYSRSFLPRSGDQFISLTPTSQNLAPESFTNYEIGAKWDIRPNLGVTFALFQLDRSNTPVVDPTNPAVTIVAPRTRTRGAEFGITGQLTSKWQISGGYTYQDAQLREDRDIRVGQVPRHQLALWNRYDFTRRFGAGIGVIRQSSQWAALHNPVAALAGVPFSLSTRLPGFTRVDAALYFKVSESVQLQLNVENLLDENYFSDAHNNNNISTGAPINARFTARVKF